MRLITSLVRTFVVVGLLAAISSAIAAFVAKGRMASSGAPADDEVDLVTIYDTVNFASTAPALRRARVTTWYGGSTVDLRGARLDPAGATFTIRAIFGGVRLVVPETWRVELKSMAMFGGIGDVRDKDHVDAAGPLLTIDGIAVFGGLGIFSEAPDLDMAAVEPTSGGLASAAAPA